jgi:hypothetical protein
MPEEKQAMPITDNTEDDITLNDIAKEKIVRRTRPALKKTVRRRGRPKGSKNKNKATISGDKDNDIKRKLRSRIKEMQTEIRASKAEYREALKKEREMVKETQQELNNALKREKALIKLFELKEEALSNYGERWTKMQIEKIQTPPKRRRRRKKAA